MCSKGVDWREDFRQQPNSPYWSSIWCWLFLLPHKLQRSLALRLRRSDRESSRTNATADSTSTLTSYCKIICGRRTGVLTCLIYRKMFIGGLNWETTDGRHSTASLHSTSICTDPALRFSQRVLLTIRRSHGVHSDARWCHRPIARLRLSYIQRPQDSQRCYGQGTLPGRQDCKLSPSFFLTQTLQICTDQNYDPKRLTPNVPFPEMNKRKPARYSLAE